METKPHKIMLLIAVGVSSLWVQSSHAQNHLPFPPPPPIGSGTGQVLGSGTNLPPPPPPPSLSGTGVPVLSGSNSLPPPPPPPALSGTDGPVLSGSNSLPPPPPPPAHSCTDGPILSGSGTLPPSPPVPRLSGTDNPPPQPPTGNIETLTEQLVFSPAGSGSASAVKALFVAINTSGTYHGSVNLVCAGLTSGTYRLVATMASDESTVVLGTFTSGGTAPNATAKPPKPAPKVAFGGKNGIPFPSDVNPLDIAALAITDADSNVLYTADLTAITDGTWMAHIALTAGEGAPNALGFADLLAKAKQGKVSGCLAIHAKGLPASSTYTYSIDGTDIGTLNTASDGTLLLKVPASALPASVDLFSVSTVEVHDDSGTTMVSAAF